MIVKLRRKNPRYPDLTVGQPYVVIGIGADEYRILYGATRRGSGRNGAQRARPRGRLVDDPGRKGEERPGASRPAHDTGRQDSRTSRRSSRRVILLVSGAA